MGSGATHGLQINRVFFSSLTVHTYFSGLRFSILLCSVSHQVDDFSISVSIFLYFFLALLRNED